MRRRRLVVLPTWYALGHSSWPEVTNFQKLSVTQKQNLTSFSIRCTCQKQKSEPLICRRQNFEILSAFQKWGRNSILHSALHRNEEEAELLHWQGQKSKYTYMKGPITGVNCNHWSFDFHILASSSFHDRSFLSSKIIFDSFFDLKCFHYLPYSTFEVSILSSIGTFSTFCFPFFYFLRYLITNGKDNHFNSLDVGCLVEVLLQHSNL